MPEIITILYAIMSYVIKKSVSHIKNGFTLLELLLYTSLVSVMLLIVSVFLSFLLESRVKNQTIAEVEQQGLQVMEAISQIVRNSEAINAPAQSTSAPSLSLDVITAGNDPTVFDVASGVIRITEGAGTPIALTNTRVIASDVLFQNLTLAGTPGTVRIQFILTHANPGGRNEYSFSKTFTGSATLRQP